MNDFQYYTPTKVVFGRGTEEQAGQLVKEQGGTRALVHFGGRSARESGLLDRVLASLDRAGVAHVELGGVVPNPRLSKVREGMELCRREGVDFLLAVGGGSVIDSAKAIALGWPTRGTCGTCSPASLPRTASRWGLCSPSPPPHDILPCSLPADKARYVLIHETSVPVVHMLPAFPLPPNKQLKNFDRK